MSRKDYYSEDQYEQDQRVEAEEVEQDWDEADENDEAENDVKYVYSLIGFLRNELENARSVPFSSGRLVDAEKCLNMLADLEMNLPEAIKRGFWAYEKTGEMVRNAQEQTRRHMASQEMQFQRRLKKHEQQMAQEESESKARASKIIADAERQADKLVSEQVIRSRVSDEIRSMKNTAQAQVNELQLRVEDECFKRLDNMSNVLGKMLKEVNRMRAEFEEE